MLFLSAIEQAPRATYALDACGVYGLFFVHNLEIGIDCLSFRV